MSKKRDDHVVPNSDRGGWDVKREGADRASGHFDRKTDAMDRGRDWLGSVGPNWCNTVETAAFKIAIATEMTPILRETGNTNPRPAGVHARRISRRLNRSYGLCCELCKRPISWVYLPAAQIESRDGQRAPKR